MLYNTYRPVKFSQVIGQQGITLLTRQSVKNRFAHAYLFFGASGAGKTTTARIVAMALLCQHKGADSEPCGQCQDCKAIQNGSHWDVLEINAAANPDIQAVQELNRKAFLCPTNGRHKVYIIDECHRYTIGAWSAMLKLVEEPPAYLTIILCTTDKAGVPDTISSRCQLINFNPVAPADIAKRLLQIATQESVNIPVNAVQQIADNCNGNIRQAETMLDQILCMAV